MNQLWVEVTNEDQTIDYLLNTSKPTEKGEFYSYTAKAWLRSVLTNQELLSILSISGKYLLVDQWEE